MKLQLISTSNVNHSGFGAGPGTIDTETYRCPCGNGTVDRVRDNIPGFKDTEIYVHCEECDNKYTFGRGTAELKE